MWGMICDLLAGLAEGYVDNSASIFTWGEVDVPECLKRNEKNE
jgi:hypothetical protein